MQRRVMPGRALVLRDKELGEAAQAPERSRFHGSKGKAQVGGDLRLGVAAEVRQHQDLALLHGQADEGAAHFMGACIALGQFSAILTVDVVQGLQRNGGVALTTQVVDRSVAGDAEHPPRQAPGGVVAAVVSPNLIEDPLQDIFGVLSTNEPLQVAEHRCPQGGIDLTDRALSIDHEPGSEIAADLFHCCLYRLPPCGAAAAAAHNRPSRTITLLLVCSSRLSVCRPLCGGWPGPSMGPAADPGRPPVPDPGSSLETPAGNTERSCRSASGLGGVAVPGPC